jgi:hypothetical protein
MFNLNNIAFIGLVSQTIATVNENEILKP